MTSILIVSLFMFVIPNVLARMDQFGTNFLTRLFWREPFFNPTPVEVTRLELAVLAIIICDFLF